jgi:SAM-dependent methyltransferase
LDELRSFRWPSIANAATRPNSVRVGWRDRQAQQRRFAQLVKIIRHNPDEAFSIADIGCGLGDFAQFLKLSGYSNVQYFGFDQNEELIAEAIEANRSEQGISFAPVRDLKALGRFDYAVASGIFSGKFDTPNALWVEHIISVLEDIDCLSQHGFAFNMLTIYSDAEKMQPYLFYGDPRFFFDLCVQRFARNVAVLQDYDEYDFTVLVRKSSGAMPQSRVAL